MSIRDQIRESALPSERVEIPEWGITVIVRGMSALDATEIGNEDGKDLYAQHLLSRCLYDETGERIYPTSTDAAELMQKSLAIVQRLLEAANRVNGIGEKKA